MDKPHCNRSPATEREAGAEIVTGGGLPSLPGRKYYVVQYPADGRVRRITLGRHGAVSTETARRHAMAAISEAKGGGDPAAARDGAPQGGDDETARQAVSVGIRP